MINEVPLIEMATPIVEQHGCDLVHLRYRREPSGWVLRLLVERTGSDPMTGSGITHQECAAISRQLGEQLEDNPVITTAYTLEVSSPGIERPLVREADYTRFRGRDAQIKTTETIAGKKKFRGVIDSVRDSRVRLSTNKGKSQVDIPLEKIAKANLVFDANVLKQRVGE